VRANPASRKRQQVRAVPSGRGPSLILQPTSSGPCSICSRVRLHACLSDCRAAVSQIVPSFVQLASDPWAGDGCGALFIYDQQSRFRQGQGWLISLVNQARTSTTQHYSSTAFRWSFCWRSSLEVSRDRRRSKSNVSSTLCSRDATWPRRTQKKLLTVRSVTNRNAKRASGSL